MSDPPSSTEIVMVCVTIILVLITGIYAFITYRISKTASKQLKFSQRPYLNIDNVEKSSFSMDNNILSVIVNYSNKSNVPVDVKSIIVIVNTKDAKVSGDIQLLASEKTGMFSFSVDLRLSVNISVMIKIYYKSVFDAEIVYTQRNFKIKGNFFRENVCFEQIQNKTGYIVDDVLNNKVCWICNKICRIFIKVD